MFDASSGQRLDYQSHHAGFGSVEGVRIEWGPSMQTEPKLLELCCRECFKTWTMEADAAAGHSVSGSFSKDPFGLDEKQVHRIHPISSGGATLCVLCHADPATPHGAHIEMPVNWGERAYM